MRDVTRPLPFRDAATAVFEVALESMMWARRSLPMGALVALPVLFAVLYRLLLASGAFVLPVTPHDLYALIVSVYWISNVLPLAALFFATALVADDVEGKTLTYLITRPLPRSSVFLGRFAAYLATALALALPSCVITFFLLTSARGFAAVGAAAGDLFRDLAVITLTLLVYGALFSLLGVLLKRPVIPGLMFLFGWEKLLVRLPGFLPRLTLNAWLCSLVKHHPAQEGLAGLFVQVLPAAQALPFLVLATACFLWAAVRVFSVREYVLEQ